MPLELAFPTPFLPMMQRHSVESRLTLALKSTRRIIVLLTFLGVLISIKCHSVDIDDGKFDQLADNLIVMTKLTPWMRLSLAILPCQDKV